MIGGGNVSYVNQLQIALRSKTQRNSRYSMRAFARSLKTSPTTLSLILAGKRVPSVQLALRIADTLSLSEQDRKIFMESVTRAHLDSMLERGTDRARHRGRTQRLAIKEIQRETFKAISSWYHYAILELTFVESFKPEPRWISAQLGISVAAATRAVDRLIDLGLLEVSEGRFRKAIEFLTTADKDVTSRAHRAHIGQVLKRGVQALKRLPIEQRSMTSLTIAIDPENIGKAKKMILDFQRKLRDELTSKRQKEVYQLGVCFYPVRMRRTQKKAKQ